MYGNFYEAVRVIMEGKISLNEKNALFGAIFRLKTIILPRQAWDRHISSKK